MFSFFRVSPFVLRIFRVSQFICICWLRGLGSYFLGLWLFSGGLYSQEPAPKPNGEAPQSAIVLLQKAAQYLEQNQYQAAFVTTNDYLTIYPRHYRVPEARFYRALAEYNLGRTEDARTALNALLASSPQQARRLGVFYWLGLCSYRFGEFDTAYDIWLRQLAVRGPEAADYLQQSYFGLAQVLSERGNHNEALRYFRLLKGPVQLRAGFAYGTLALKMGLYREAYHAFGAYLIQKDVAGGPSRSQALFYQAQSAFFANLLPQAKDGLDTVLRLYRRDERLFQAALIMRLRIAIQEADSAVAERLYEEAKKRNYGFGDWLRSVEFPLFLLLGRYSLALQQVRSRPLRSRTEREIARFDRALVLAFIDVRIAIRQMERLRSSFIRDIRERARFHAGRLQVEFPLTVAKGLSELEGYLEKYPEGLYAKDTVRILLRIYRADPERFWLRASALLGQLTESEHWQREECARFYLYWAEMAKQLGNEGASLRYLHKSQRLAPRSLVGLQSYYRIGAVYFAQNKYARALGYFREVELQLDALSRKGETQELGFYTALGIAMAYAGSGKGALAIERFARLIGQSHGAGRERSAQQAELQLGLVYFYQKNYRQAVETFDAIIAQGSLDFSGVSSGTIEYPPMLQALYWKGEALFRQGLFAAARQSFRRVNEMYPEILGTKAYLRAALAARAAGDYNSVIEDLTEAQQALAANDLWQLLHVDFQLIKYNLLLGRDVTATEAAGHLLESLPGGYDFVGEAFLEAAELYFNRGELERSEQILKLLEKKFMNRVSRNRTKNKRTGNTTSEKDWQQVTEDAVLNENIQNGLFSFDATLFLKRYGGKGTATAQSGLGRRNIDFYLEDGNAPQNEALNMALSSSIFAGLYLQGLIYVQKQNYGKAFRYFLNYLRKDPFGAYALSVVSSVLQLLPELNEKHSQQLLISLRQARLDDALGSLLFVRYWSLQPNNRAKKRALEQIARQTLSIEARKEALFHLSEYYNQRGDAKRAEQLLLDLRNTENKNPQIAEDSDNYWAGQANLELGRRAYKERLFEDAKAFFATVGPQAERETLAEALFWLASIARFEGNAAEERMHRQRLQELAPDSEWLRRLGE